MKTIELTEHHLTIEDLLEIAADETIILHQSGKRGFVVSPIDDFALEVELLQNNKEFMAYLDEISKEKASITLEDVEKRLGF
ncbi:MAG: hypothetical protein BWK80_01610 [Desulfobacteraceae bacterium IS3]|nr:MAG: hypothetical protein BWK80_01610 [Desulfobacteraceae bacterium IS3]